MSRQSLLIRLLIYVFSGVSAMVYAYHFPRAGESAIPYWGSVALLVLAGMLMLTAAIQCLVALAKGESRNEPSVGEG